MGRRRVYERPDRPLGRWINAISATAFVVGGSLFAIGGGASSG